MRKFVTALVAISTLAAGSLIILPALPAFAVTCPSPFNADGQAFKWTHTSGGSNDVMGVRAGVKFLKDADLCDPGMTNIAQSQAVTVGIEEIGGTSDEQVAMGFIQDYNPFRQNEWCKIWETASTLLQRYDCTGLSIDDEENFDIHQDSSGNHYVLDDCGTNTGDYSDCVTKDMTQTDFDSPRAVIGQQELFEACTQHMFGSSGDQEKVGSPTGAILPIQGLDSSGTWTARDWGIQSDLQTCVNGGNYTWNEKDSNPTHGVNWFDSRN